MKLSKRLIKISKFIPKNKVIFDVGSDHGLLPCFLVIHNDAVKVYAGDNKKGPLLKAIGNIKKYQLEDKIEAVLSDGLDMAKDDVQIVVIAGMGVHTAIKILDKANLTDYERIIIQVNKDMPLIREYAVNNNLKIIDEAVVYDEFYYEIIVLVPNSKVNYSEKELKYGPILLKNKDEEFKHYLLFQMDKIKKIISVHHSIKLENRLQELEEIYRQIS